MSVRIPRLVIAGLSGDSGKTIASLSLAASLRRSGLAVAAFKKGPDYIDSAWLTRVSGSACRNLDTFMVDPDRVYDGFVTHAAHADIAIIEGNRGLFDGRDVSGTHSTAQLARLLKAPVVLVVDVTKVTRTVAALIKGCQAFDRNVQIAGVILNRVAGSRHQRIITESIATYCDLPVVGAIPRLGDHSHLIPGRHLGLVPPAEFGEGDDFGAGLLDIAGRYLDGERLLETARSAEALRRSGVGAPAAMAPVARIGYFSDSAFTFYYPENLEALEASGAQLIPISSFEKTSLPDVDGLYIGGGFPETHAQRLADNRDLLRSVKSAAVGGMPIYAECGGLIYLSRSLTWRSEVYAMAGVFPVDLSMSAKPVGHGYCEMTVDHPNPFFSVGDKVRGHEFHYSGPAGAASEIESCFDVGVGVGIGQRRDGLLHKSTLASYMHIHGEGVPQWAPNFVKAARDFRAGGSGGTMEAIDDRDGRGSTNFRTGIGSASELMGMKIG